jgi:pilus assembly protein Flp/PilA
MINKLMNFFYDEEGASMVEYGLLVALIALVVAVGASTLGNAVNVLFDAAADKTVVPTAS